MNIFAFIMDFYKFYIEQIINNDIYKYTFKENILCCCYDNINNIVYYLLYKTNLYF